ncbi:MAG: 16S rRNA (cytosine(1402)-N(4))-methyltransferase, partial [bacterium]|nr:16S rRNA (cytosine(1402)-N(4))-methyltransferase [bacterium]
RIVAQSVHEKNTESRTVSRVLQALRIYVNRELDALDKGLLGAQKILKTGGRLAVVSFHSLEDRRVKNFMKGFGWVRPVKQALLPTSDEVNRNSRSRSAKMRFAVKTL